MTPDDLNPTPPSSPLMGTSPLSDPPELVRPESEPESEPEPEPEPDDIIDPPIPATLLDALAATSAPPPLPDKFGEHEALFRGAAQHIINQVKQGMAETSRDASKSLNDMYTHVAALIHEDQQRLRNAETLLDQLAMKIAHEGILVRADPYQLTVQALAPQGYPITMRLAGPTMAETIQDTARFIDWLVKNEFKPC